MKKILFVCIENAGRSQMAEAFAKHYGDGKVEALSAGTKPSNQVNPLVLRVMRERGIDISKNKPKRITTRMVQEADMIVTMGCDAQGFCPAQMLGRVTDWQVEDPKDKPVQRVREIRDEIEARVRTLIKEIG